MLKERSAVKDLSHKTALRGVKIFARAQFSEGMAQNLLLACQMAGHESTVELEISNAGVWCRIGGEFRHFIGSATPISNVN